MDRGRGRSGLSPRAAALPHLSPEEYVQVIANEEDHRDEIEAQRQDEDDADE